MAVATKSKHTILSGLAILFILLYLSLIHHSVKCVDLTPVLPIQSSFLRIIF